ncbi:MULTISPECIES: hypothetical protein [Paenibacillus]|uniref:hypothetical protein n=1 Tax=Paenibacillus TaxID=44249 RepID=UPI001FC9B641|nr:MULTISPECIES: hypothetical protein [Paenibacillus]
MGTEPEVKQHPFAGEEDFQMKVKLQEVLVVALPYYWNLLFRCSRCLRGGK